MVTISCVNIALSVSNKLTALVTLVRLGRLVQIHTSDMEESGDDVFSLFTETAEE